MARLTSFRFVSVLFLPAVALGLGLVLAACTDSTPRAGTDAGTQPDVTNGEDAGTVDAGGGTDACVPACDTAECGPDGCGGTCGSCEEGQSCAAGMCMGGRGGTCPPEGPGGTAVGDVVPDLTLTDTEGVEHSIRSSCEKTTWIFNFSGWCPPCREFANGPANDLLAAYSTDEVQGYFAISQTNSFGAAPTMEFCQSIKDQYDLGMPVLCDTEGVLVRELDATPNSYSVVLNRGSTIHWRAQYRESSMAGQVRDSLGL